MCEAFADAGHDVTLFARPGEADPSESLYDWYGVRRNFETVMCRATGWPRLREWTYAARVRSQIRKRAPWDVIFGRHLPSLALAATQVPFIYEAHQPASRSGRLVERRLFRRANLRRVVFISEALRQHYRTEFGSLQRDDRLTLVAHDAAKCPDRNPVPAAAPDDDRLQVGYSGSLYPGRGIDLITRLATRMPHIDFHVAGGPEDSATAWRHSTDNMRNMRFHGHLPPADLTAWQRSMHILLAPYQFSVPIARWFSPLKIFEYMVSGVPFIASDLPVLRETLSSGRTALLVEADDIAAWEDAVQKLHNPFLRRKLALEAFQAASQWYSWPMRAANVLAGIGSSAALRAA